MYWVRDMNLDNEGIIYILGNINICTMVCSNQPMRLLNFR